MRVDVVAAPMRYRRMPLMLLLVIAVLPAAGLLALHRWLDAEADRYDLSSATIAEREQVVLERPGGATAVPATSDADVGGGTVGGAVGGAGIDGGVTGPDGVAAPGAPAPVLATALFDFRRLPGPILDLANSRQLGIEVAPLFGFLNDRSCAAVSVGGRIAAVHNADTPVVPASTQKLVVAAVALDVLGPEYTFETSVRVPPIVDGVVDGDVYLVGGGDPLLTADDYPIDDDTLPAFGTTSLDVLADAFVANGVERITGTVIGDGTRYDDEFVIDEWGDGVAGVEAGPYDALLVNDARVRDRSGRQDDPNVGAAREFVRLLGDRGVRVNNGWGSGQASTTTTTIGTVESVPLSEIVREMLTTSDNNTAEMLVKELGFVDSGVGTRAAGLTVIDRTLRSWGVPADGVRVLDGSGLHLRNEMTCEALLAVLQRSRGTALAAGLAVAAETGTLRDEFVDSPMAGRLYAKTGTLGNPPADEPPPASKALAGYVSVDNGDTIEFVLIINDDEIADENYRSLWDAFGNRFATYPDGPDPATIGVG